MGLFIHKLMGAGIIVTASVIAAVAHPSQIRYIPKKSADMIRYMMAD